MGWTKRWRKRLRALFRKEAVERELDEELAFHLEMETRKHLAAGLGPEEARRRAALAFGGVEKHKEEVREARWLGWAPGLSLDLRLGLRMLVKHPGLTLVGGLGMAVAIALGALFDVSASLVDAALPLEEGDRIVAVESWDAETNNQERRILHDFAAWRRELTTVRDLAAYRDVSRNLIVPGAPPEGVRVAEMTASGFRVARVPPRLGRYLLPGDEAEGAPPVAVIGHEVWRSHFGGDPAVVGREVRLGTEAYAVVGVMPEGFAFPMSHGLWVPLRVREAGLEPREGPGIRVFGRLAPGATLERARAELATLGRRMAAELPETHGRLRPRVVPYTAQLFDDMQGWEVPAVRLMLTLLLGVICVNVAVLVYARTATRRGEITVRSALGASRRRIVTQLFAEALVLAGAAAAAGLAVAATVLGRLDALAGRVGESMGGLPFWIDFRLSSRTVLYVVGLAVLAAVIVGVVPALKATGRRLQDGLRELGGGTGLRMGRTWTVLIVAQVGFAVAATPAAVFYAWEYLRFGIAEPGFEAGEYLTGLLVMEPGSPPAAEGGPEGRFAERLTALTERLRTDPAVAGVTFSAERAGNGPAIRVEVEDGPAPAEGGVGHPVRVSRVGADFFETFGVAASAGRGFGAGDTEPGATAVIVNEAFVRDVLGGGNALGRRLRHVEGHRSGGVVRSLERGEPGRWYEVVGVVGDFPPNAMEPGLPEARVYHAIAPGAVYPVSLSVRVRDGSPAGFAPRLRGTAATLDPGLQLLEVLPLDRALGQLQAGMRLGGLALGLLTLSVLLLSGAGIYALTSLTVTQRRREIGIRSALGAHPGRILASVFSRAAGQLGLGALAGLAVAILLDRLTGGGLTGGRGAVVLPAVALLMVTVGLLAALGPARRGLRIQPMEALKAD